MFADEAVEQAGVTLAAVAVAIARLLIENFFDAGGDGVSVLDDGIAKSVRSHGRGERAGGRFGVKSGHGLDGIGLRLAGTGGLLRQEQ